MAKGQEETPLYGLTAKGGQVYPVMINPPIPEVAEALDLFNNNWVVTFQGPFDRLRAGKFGHLVYVLFGPPDEQISVVELKPRGGSKCNIRVDCPKYLLVSLPGDLYFRLPPRELSPSG
ncbi:unnamed protein product [marine sediment metagenome]|uniref:Uncharacterized protein n=1 Tax=marine sediment metagenome TaxID=412755 RepID=X1IU65_9ZZZZ